MIITIISVATSCGGCGNRDTIRQISTAVDEARAIAEEEGEATSLSDRVFQLTGEDLYDGDRAMSEEEWEKMEQLTNDLEALTSEGAASINKEAVEEVFRKHGYETFDDGRRAISGLARFNDYQTTLAMSISFHQTRRMTGDTEGAEEEAEKLRKRITEEWKLTKEDIKALDEKSDILAKAMAINMVLSFMR